MEGCREDEEGDEDGDSWKEKSRGHWRIRCGTFTSTTSLNYSSFIFLFEDIYYFVGFIFDNVSSSHLFICLSEINYFQVTKIKYTFLIIRQIFVLSTNALLFVSL